MRARIVVVGSCNTDMVILVPRIPAPGETVTGGTFFHADGGKGANQAVASARLGAHVAFVGRVGRDDLGEHSLLGLRQEGIDIEFVVRDPEAASGVALISVDESGENAIAVAPGANGRLSVEDVEAAAQLIETADVLLLQLETPIEAVERAASIAAVAGARVILNPAPARPLPASLFGLVDVLTPNEGEARTLSGESEVSASAASLLGRGAGSVVVTLGRRGALLVAPDSERMVPSIPVDAVDSTAAGDAFNGALAVGLAEGMTLEGSVRFGCAAGALAATIAGARPSLPTRERVESLLGRG